MGYSDRCDVSVLLGKTLKSVVQSGNDEIRFTTNEDEVYLMYHSQDCCEGVSIEDVNGDLEELVGFPLTQAEEVDYDGGMLDGSDSCYSWTFYKFATIKGYVTIRWYGSSNGYYSERVDLVRI